jgi:hypothetical protein
MNLAAAFNAPPKRNNQCKWSHWWVQLSEKDRTDITHAFNDWNIETSHITRVLREYGCPLSDTTIRTHRRNECKTCAR